MEKLWWSLTGIGFFAKGSMAGTSISLRKKSLLGSRDITFPLQMKCQRVPVQVNQIVVIDHAS